MEKRDIIRALTWGLAFVILAVAGIYGMILNNDSNYSVSSNKLESLTQYINENVATKNLAEGGTVLKAELIGSKIEISYINNTENKSYEYTYTNNNLNTSFSNNDETAKEVLKIVLSSNAQNLGKSYSDIILKFSDLDLESYNITEGLNYEVTDKTNVIINTLVSLTIKDPEYFTNTDLTPGISSILNGEYTTSKGNLKLNINGATNPIITISEETEITNNSYKSIISVLNIMFEDKEIISYFEENYSFVTLGNKTFNGFKIEINPTLNNNEKTIFTSEEKIIRITINNNQLSI